MRERVTVTDRLIRDPTTDPLAIGDAVRLLNAGQLVAFPTETVYGLGALAFDQAAVARIFAAKGRPQDNPLIVHLASPDDLHLVARDVPQVARELMDSFWPGPLTLVFRRQARVPDAVTAGLDTLAVRVPDHPIALGLIRALGAPIAAPSANRSGRPSPTTAAHVANDFGASIPLILDGGSTLVGLESTVVDVTDRIPRLLRPGGVSLEELRAAIGAVEWRPDDGAEARAPGMRHRHYAPSCRIVLASPVEISATIAQLLQDGASVGVLCCSPLPAAAELRFFRSIGGSLHEYGREIFRAFRDAEEQGVEVLVVETVSEQGVGLAVMDRLRRAAAGSDQSLGLRG